MYSRTIACSLLLVAITYTEGSFGAEPDETVLTSLNLVQLKASRHNRSALMEVFATEALAGMTCAGGTTPGSTNWVQETSNVIKVSVDTSVCGFDATPNYVTALGGDNNHWTSTGSSEVYEPTATGFTLYIYFSGVTPAYANDASRKWHVNWIAHQDGKETPAGATCAGDSGSGTTTWLQGTSDGIYTNVDTSVCGFSTTPSYLSSLVGDGSSMAHYSTRGSSEVYSATATGFTIHIYKAGITVADAVANNWHMNWVAHTEGNHVSSGGVTCAGKSSTSAWVQEEGLRVDIDTSVCGFSTRPRYVTSLGGTQSHWGTLGGSEIYAQTATGFTIYIATAATVADAQSWGWHVNWMATAETGVSALEDPHMSNVVGELFNILRPGTHTLVEVPGEASEHQLFISARIDQLLDKCHTGGLYVKSLNISGSLLNTVRPLTIDVVSKETDAIDMLHVNTEQTGATTAKEFAKAKAGLATFDQPNPYRQNLNLEVGGISVNIAGRRQEIQERHMQIDFIDLRIKGLSAYKHVGGLLGTDDHTLASTAPVECATLMQAVPATGSANTGSRLVAK